MRRYVLVVHGKDTWGEKTFDLLEAAARGRIVSHSDDGSGNSVFKIQPRYEMNMQMRKHILKIVREITSQVYWKQI